MSLEFFFTSSTLGGLTRLILGAVITALLWRNRGTNARFLAQAFFAITIFNVFIFVTDGMLPPLTDYLNPPENVPLLWAMLGLIPFVYNFPELVFKRESLWARRAALAYALFGTALVFGQFYAAATGHLEWFDPIRAYQISGVLVLFVWCAIVMGRQWAHWARAGLHAARAAGERANLLRELIFPRLKNAAAARAFLGVFLLPVVLLLTDSTFGFVKARPDYVLNLGLLLIFYAFVMAYFSYSPEQATFMHRLLVSTLVVVLSVLAVVGQTIMPFIVATYNKDRLLEVQTLAEHYAALNYTAPPLAAFTARTAADGTLVPVTTAPGLDWPAVAAVLTSKGLTAREATKETIHSGLHTDEYFQVYVRPSGTQYFIIGYPLRESFAFMHEQGGIPIAQLITAATLITVLLFPIFFRANLVHPLENLLDGVRRVNEGERDVQLTAQYADEIGFLTTSFNHMVASLRQADSLKDEFLANTSHELRTPLNGIIGIADSLLDGAAGPLTPAQAQNLTLVVTSGRRLAALVNDLLDFSKLRHHEITLQLSAVDVRAAVNVVLTLSRPLLGTKDVQLVNAVPETLPLAAADENRLQQILHNLIGNAIKFTKQGAITVSAQATGHMLTVSVRDTGIGVAPDKLGRIFEAFEQADGSIAREYGGTGLGLSVTQKLVKIHGGTLSVTSELGTGTEFTFTLPLATAATRAAQPSAPTPVLSTLTPIAESHTPETPTTIASPAAAGTPATAAAPEYTGSGFTILIVDDEPINLQVLYNQLTLHLYTVVQALSGPEALDLIENGLHPDLIILDVMMPRMSGYEFCQTVRAYLAPAEVPIIMLTARNQVTDLVEGLSVGANDYMVKPFSKHELLARIRTHLTLAQINGAYARFVPRQFLDQLGHADIITVHLGDHVQKEMTVMFADIRDFTTISEGMTPQENFHFVNTLLGSLGPAIRQNGGFIDKFLGDGVMAIFPRSADDALQAAVSMLALINDYNVTQRTGGLPPVRIGIGLHTGALMLGTVGEAQRMDGTAISDVVNAASRLEGLTKRFGCALVVSEETLARATEREVYDCRFLGRVQVKGKRAAIAVYEVFNGDAPAQRRAKQATLADFEAAVHMYAEQRFAEAHARFAAIAQANPDDATAARYTERAAQRVAREPEWDGLV